MLICDHWFHGLIGSKVLLDLSFATYTLPDDGSRWVQKYLGTN